MISWQTIVQISHVTKKPFIGDNCELKAQQWCPHPPFVYQSGGSGD